LKTVLQGVRQLLLKNRDIHNEKDAAPQGLSVRRSYPRGAKHFTGYKPCFPERGATNGAWISDPIGTRILLINLDAMGNVLVTTSILPAIRRRVP